MSAKITISFDNRNKSSPHSVRWLGEEINPKTGNLRRYCKSFRTKAEARQFAAKKTVEVGEGVNVDKPKGTSLNSYRKEWRCVQQSELSPASLDSYDNTFNRLENFFGKNCTLRSINTRRARRFVAEQKRLVNPSKELSDWSRDQIKRNCKSIFNRAVEDELLVKNPFGPIKSKKLPMKRWHCVTMAEYVNLLAFAPSLRLKVAYAILYTGGVRLSEAFNLTWDCVDFGNGKLIIANREGTNDMPPFKIKDKDEREIPLPKDTIDLLTQWQDKSPEKVPFILLTSERYEMVKAKWQRIRKQGQPWRNRYVVNNVLRDFKRHYKRAGIRPTGTLTIHTLRKSCGQNWADALPMNVVKELMGHSNIATTAKFYNQVDEVHETKAARVIQEQLEKAKSDVLSTYEPNLVEKRAGV